MNNRARPTPTRTRRGFVRSYGPAIKALRRRALECAKESDAYKVALFHYLASRRTHEAAAFDLAANHLASLPDREPKPDTKGRGKR